MPMLTFSIVYSKVLAQVSKIDIPPSNCFGRNDKPALPETPLSVHLANWQSAEIDMEVTRNLVREEINQGWVYEFEGGIEAAKDSAVLV